MMMAPSHSGPDATAVASTREPITRSPHAQRENIGGLRLPPRLRASAAGVSVEVLHERWESDRLGWAGDPDAIDDFQNSSTQTLSYGAAGGNKDRTLRVALPITTDDDTDANYEMYQKVKFRVTSGAVTGTWSTPNLSAAQKIWA